MNRYVKSKHAKFNFENLGKMKQKSQNIHTKIPSRAMPGWEEGCL